MIAAVLAAVGLFPSAVGWAPQTSVGDEGARLPEFRLRDLDGHESGWSPGKPVVLTFVAFWCDTWKEQLPRFDQARRSLEGTGVPFLAVTADGSRAEVAKGLGRKVLLDRDGHLAKTLHLDRIPTTLLLDEKGRAVWRRDGIVRPEELTDAVRRQLLGPSKDKVAYLTFDDFPARRLNDELLDLLRAEQVSAAFFVIGKNAQTDPMPVRRAASEGHSIQVHAWDHSANANSRKDDPERCARLLREITGEAPALLRPHGTEKLYALGDSGPVLLMPQPPIADPYDFALPGKGELVRRISLALKPGVVIQLHAGVPDTLAALPGIIALLRDRGYRLEALR